MIAPPVSGQAHADPRKATSPTFAARPHRRTHHRARHRTFRHVAVGLSPMVLAEWTRVAVCEEGGWIGYAGPAYPDSLGISAANWYANGGGSDLSPAAQIKVAQRIEGGGYVPDQSGCAAW